jgi:uncharacterized protein YuzE
MTTPLGGPQLRYDPDANAFYVRLAPAPEGAARRTEVNPDGIIMEFADDILIGIEVLTVAERRLSAAMFPSNVANLVERLYQSGAIDRREPIIIDG